VKRIPKQFWKQTAGLRLGRAMGCMFLASVALGVQARSVPDDVPKGAVLLKPFKMGLKSALAGGMSQGVDAAIRACSTQAPAIAEEHSVDGVTMGRSSHRLRNPDNAPEPWLAEVLEDYLSGERELTPRTLALDEHREAYVEPIRLQAPCLACHGETLATEVEQRLQELYPQDQATGFAIGDLRGVFWVTYPGSGLGEEPDSRGAE